MGDLKRATKLLRKQPNDPEALEKLNAYRRFRLNCLRTSLQFIQQASPPKRVLISARLKRIRSIRRKLIRGQRGSINEMDDIIGFRVICESFSEARELGKRIRDICEVRIKNYLDSRHTKNIGYRAIHGIIRFNQPFTATTVKVRFEIQIRTWYQHLWACWCESHGEHAKEGFMDNFGNEKEISELKELLLKTSQVIADWEQSYPLKSQHELPEYTGPFNVALAWHDNRNNFGFDPFGFDIDGAVNELYRLESYSDTEPLLLVGVGKSDQIKNILAETHPKFMVRKSLEPKHWMP
ncbi:MAG: RelA/SpoT domain-containing protein [Gammaproteobacteria bacterium]|nr:RelA/SpoT domain-containing protein [Gammaproteobacteria bacterium]MCY4228467.1 RelA/SpoT domain-containing protein [Gammaproteobacteria bacterium]